jgi:hypothetical protein
MAVNKSVDIKNLLEQEKEEKRKGKRTREEKEIKVDKNKGSGLNKVIKAFESYLNNYENEWVVEEQDPKRYFYLRPSSFPYCGFRKVLNANKDIDAPRLNTFASTYFTQVGHTTHAVFQAFGGRGGKLVGDWECKTCGEWRKFSTDHKCKCGEDMHYHELEIKYRGIVLGHIDGLFRLDPSKGNKSIHVMVDYKTTSTKKIALKGAKSPFPYGYNVSQIEAYVPLAEIQYEITVDYWLLIYLARDAPFKWGRAIKGKHLTIDDKDKIKKKIDRWVKTHRLVLKAETTEHFEKIETRKLCKSLEDYNSNYKEEYNSCEFCDKCFTASDELIKKALKYKVYPLINHAPKKVRLHLKETEQEEKDNK